MILHEEYEIKNCLHYIKMYTKVTEVSKLSLVVLGSGGNDCGKITRG